MLLRGVKFATPMLNSADVRAVKGRAQNSGRSFGGAPFRGGGRGGRMDYGSDRGGNQGGPGRPNPFAAHLDPRFMPGQQTNTAPGWVPPGQGGGDYSRGPPGPPRGSMSNQYGYNQGHQQGYQQDHYGHGHGGHRGGYGSHDNRGRGGYRGGGGGGGGRYRGNRGGGGHY